jgi:hypothetical protein
MPTVVIDARFCGPPGMGNGGYVCGRLAAFVPSVTAEVTLMRPVPLDRELQVDTDEDDAVLLRDGEMQIAKARPAELDIEAPVHVLPSAAYEASTGYIGFVAHAFPRCFVCGPERARGDGMRIFPGSPSERGDVVAALWTPDASLAAKSKASIPYAFVWAALECHGAFALMKGDASRPMLLGRITARIEQTVGPGEECVVLAWRIGEEGRKLIAGSAVYADDGSLRGIGRAVWFVAWRFSAATYCFSKSVILQPTSRICA